MFAALLIASEKYSRAGYPVPFYKDKYFSLCCGFVLSPRLKSVKGRPEEFRRLVGQAGTKKKREKLSLYFFRHLLLDRGNLSRYPSFRRLSRCFTNSSIYLFFFFFFCGKTTLVRMENIRNIPVISIQTASTVPTNHDHVKDGAAEAEAAAVVSVLSLFKEEAGCH